MTTKETTEWDDKVPGLHLRHRQTRSSWHLSYRTKERRARNPKLGDARVLSLTQAREIGREWLARVAKGEDPASRPDEKPTLRELYARYVDEWPDDIKPRTWRDCYEPIWRLHILPLLGDLAVADLSLADASRLKTRLSGTPHQANRALSVLSRACELAETEWGWRPLNSNPVKCGRFEEVGRKRVPTRAEADRLFHAIESERTHDPIFVGFLDLLLTTGCRKGEWLGAKWEWIDENGLHLGDSKVGPRTIRLNAPARAVLAALRGVSSNPYVLPGRLENSPLSSPKKQWARLLAKAAIPNLRMHDLRRYFASVGLSAGLTLEAVGQLLGHTQAQTTKRYAFLLTDAAQAAAETAGAALQAAAMRSTSPASV